MGLGLEATRMRPTTLLWVLAIAVFGFRAATQEESGNRAYRKGDYSAAVERYREAVARSGGSPRLQYNLGTALFRLGESEDARETLIRSLEAQSPELRARAFHNLGNALAAEPQGAADPENLGAAIDAYRRSLMLDPHRDDTRWNMELALRRLQEAENQQTQSAGEQEPQQTPEDPSDAGRQPRQGGSGSQIPRPGETQPSPAEAGGQDSPLPKELAEQILRAVEEQERGLQREKLRQQRRRVRGPDW